MVAVAADVTVDQRLRRAMEAAAPYLNAGTWFSHRSAALAHGLPVLLQPDTLVEVIRTFGGHGNRSRHLHARAATLGPDEALWVDGWPVTSLPRTVADLACTAGFCEAVMVVDAALRRGVDRDALLAAVGERRGRRKAERAIVFGSPLSESPGESQSRARIALAGLPAPELQVVVRASNGRFLARPDFLWRGRRLIGEYDGEGKYTGQYGVSPLAAIRSEKERQAALEAEGYAVLRWDKTVLRCPGELERRVRRALAARPHVLGNAP